jgi:hypothetical protein
MRLYTQAKSQGRDENNNLLSLYPQLPLRGDDAENHSADTNECYMTALVTSRVALVCVYVCVRVFFASINFYSLASPSFSL